MSPFFSLSVGYNTGAAGHVNGNADVFSCIKRVFQVFYPSNASQNIR